MTLKLGLSSFSGCFSFSAATILVSLLLPSTMTMAQEFGYCTIAECTSEYQKLADEYGDHVKLMAPEDCAIQSDCIEKGKYIEKLPINENECTIDRYRELLSQVEGVEAEYHALPNKYPVSLQSFYIGESPVGKGLKHILQEHFVKCEEANLFPGELNKCLSFECDDKLGKIQTLEVSSKGCGNSGKWGISKLLESRTPYKFEERILKTAVEKHEDACKNSNFMPVGMRLGLTVYVRDMPTLDFAEQAEEKARQALKNLQVTKEECTIETYESVKKDIDAMRTNYAKLSPANYRKKQADNFSAILAQHLIDCEKGRLLSLATTECLSENCQSAINKLEALKVNPEECQEVSSLLSNTGLVLKSEASYINKKKNEFLTQCEAQGFLPKTKVSPEDSALQMASIDSHPEAASNKPSSSMDADQTLEVQNIVSQIDKTLTPQQSNLLRHLYLIEVAEPNTTSNNDYPPISLLLLSRHLQTLSANVNAETCDREKAYLPLYTSLSYFENQFENDNLPFPKELIDLRKKLWQYREQCVRAGF